ncbi:hypothetical protein GUJ93_ZPchr0001g31251 [Zizania palustris]|uniref:Uncharacterized protein n=1 Tax=Zizania palustris TaxID=103762 RepID=A0A8J5RFH9_ZIZPA|nr:hypothetical protein GUJ93_ZPchr0001g31251 [Zizania palustris]
MVAHFNSTKLAIHEAQMQSGGDGSRAVMGSGVAMVSRPAMGSKGSDGLQDSGRVLRGRRRTPGIATALGR